MEAIKVTEKDYPIEHQRLNHFKTFEEQHKFAKQTKTIYAAALLNEDHHGSFREFRDTFRASRDEFEKFITEYN